MKSMQKNVNILIHAASETQKICRVAICK